MNLSDLSSWQPLLQAEFEKPFWKKLSAQVDQAYTAEEIYPPQEALFSAFALTPPEQVRVVILGQDPYHEPGQAHGLAFSVQSGTKLPPSLVNIYKELSTDIGRPARTDGCLTDWANQGVLLLNTVLTVQRGKANSHKSFGWQKFTDAVIAATAQLPQPIVYILWGAQAQKKSVLIESGVGPRLILTGPHPSPLSAYRGFFGSRPFSQANRFLTAHGEPPVAW